MLDLPLRALDFLWALECSSLPQHLHSLTVFRHEVQGRQIEFMKIVTINSSKYRYHHDRVLFAPEERGSDVRLVQVRHDFYASVPGGLFLVPLRNPLDEALLEIRFMNRDEQLQRISGRQLV